MITPEYPVRKLVDIGWRVAAGGLIIGSAVGCDPAPVPNRPKSVSELRTPAPSVWFSELRTYYNREFPSSLVEKIALDMIQSTEYPSIVAGGNLLFDNYHNQERLKNLLPVYPSDNPFPITVGFSNQLEGRTRALFQIGALGDTAYEIILRDRQTDQVKRFMGAKENPPRKYDIFLNSLLVDVGGSGWSYKLLLAKEASHLLYMKQQVEDVWDSVNQRYDVRGGDEMKAILWNTTMHKRNPQLRVPNLTPHFDRGEEFLDYAGYWHINADIQRLKREGKLSQKDMSILEANIAMSDASVDSKLLIPNDEGSFNWKDGVGPFSDEWISLVDRVLTRLTY